MPETVFLSSTFADLQEHRKSVLYVLQRMKTLLEAMEYFGAEADAPMDVCLRAVDRADIYVLVVGMRYGSTDPQGTSITQREYERASESKKRIYVYLIDEERHLVAPKDVQRDEGAERLQRFKDLLRQRHVCMRFESPADLAGKVALDLVRDLTPDRSVNEKVEAMVAELKSVRLNAGYGIGLRPLTTLARAIPTESSGTALLADPYVHLAASAAAIAASIARSDFSILRGMLAFDKQELDLVIALLTVWTVDQDAVASAIRATNDPMKFRILTAIAGRLRLVDTSSAICDAMLNRYAMHLQFKQLGQMATPIKDVARVALVSMGKPALPIVERYAARAKELRRWQQKELFESIVREVGRAPPPSDA
ncbi:DUF4062 domain-containing protein [Candidatus Accumulibacter vicinus]|uniref:DUF4062 domain-containing protein n=1 Tax=Candidatus Accumulibacter vicinus TaxID=2954382 RepID=A0A084XZ58_9PROT|nr:DUF4062 domain-containing protein [Candidatus Accumulibacter vicinus]KFB67752.1 MAG: hypothetical protein CAPSK01_002794 [Candidatus Accumulibacter vicinus]